MITALDVCKFYCRGDVAITVREKSNCVAGVWSDYVGVCECV